MRGGPLLWAIALRDDGSILCKKKGGKWRGRVFAGAPDDGFSDNAAGVQGQEKPQAGILDKPWLSPRRPPLPLKKGRASTGIPQEKPPARVS